MAEDTLIHRDTIEVQLRSYPEARKSTLKGIKHTLRWLQYLTYTLK
jgi:hypothetical protein